MIEPENGQLHAWDDYLSTFVQRVPRYAVKVPGRFWTTKPGPLSDRPIKAHLEGQYAVGVYGAAYPLYGVLDIDDRDPGEVADIRAALSLDGSNSMLFTSESAGSYHVYFRPEYNGRPPSIGLLGTIFRDFARSNRIEVYPQWRHAIRLPFGPKQVPADEDARGISSWESGVHFFGKLDPLDIRNVRGAQLSLEVPVIGKPQVPKVAAAAELFEHGLQAHGTRSEAQFQILLALWRANVPQESAEGIVWTWITRRHNDFSVDILRRPKAVRSHITRQATSIWGRYDFGRVLPDHPALAHEGFISKPDLLEIIRATKGNLPRSRFLHKLIKFMNPRRERISIGLSRDRLVSWSSWRTYNRYLKELGFLGIVRRGRSYQVDKFSKSIKVVWPWTPREAAVLRDGRSVEDFDDAIRSVLRPDEFRQALDAQGRERNRAFEAVRAVFRPTASAPEKNRIPLSENPL
jgi:hypothetical protein